MPHTVHFSNTLLMQNLIKYKEIQNTFCDIAKDYSEQHNHDSGVNIGCVLPSINPVKSCLLYKTKIGWL